MPVGIAFVPSFVSRLLFGNELTGAALMFGRITGIALINWVSHAGRVRRCPTTNRDANVES